MCAPSRRARRPGPPLFVLAPTLTDVVRAQGDMVEYNQCQAMLRNLYELGIPGKVEEFTAYRILMLLHGRNRSGTPVPMPPLDMF